MDLVMGWMCSSPAMEWMTEHDAPATMAILSNIRSHMAESGEWKRKGAALSDVTAQKEYGLAPETVLSGNMCWLSLATEIV